MVNTSNYLDLSTFESRYLTRWQQWSLAGIVILICGVGSLIAPIYIVAAVIGVLVFGILTFTTERAALYLTIAGCTLLMMKPQQDGQSFGAIDIAAGLLLGGLLLYWSLTITLVHRERLTESIPMLAFIGYYMWAIVSGIGGILWWNNTFNDWIREILIQVVLFITPILLFRAIRTNEEAKTLLKFVVICWFLLTVTNFYHYGSNIAKAAYMYQTGRGSVDPGGGSFGFFCVISFVMIDRKRSRLKYYVLAGGITVCSILASFYRTFWLAAALQVPLIFFLSRKEERKLGKRFFFWFGLIGIAALTVVYIKVALFRVFVEVYIDRLLSSSQVATDLSLVNRYVEWGRLWNTIIQNPIVGFGYGAHFHSFNIILGWHELMGYSHNGFLLVFFKSGLVGLLLFSVAYFGFIVKGFQLVRSKFLTAGERAALRATISYLIATAITTLTVNAFNDRIQALWIAVSWGAIMYFTRRVRQAQAASTQTTSVVAVLPASDALYEQPNIQST